MILCLAVLVEHQRLTDRRTDKHTMTESRLRRYHSVARVMPFETVRRGYVVVVSASRELSTPTPKSATVQTLAVVVGCC